MEKGCYYDNCDLVSLETLKILLLPYYFEYSSIHFSCYLILIL